MLRFLRAVFASGASLTAAAASLVESKLSGALEKLGLQVHG